MRISRRHEPAGEHPTPEQLERWRRRMSPPENELPAGVGLTVLLGRNDDAAVGITLMESFSTGFQFTLAVRLREARPGLARGGLFELIEPGVHADPEIPLSSRLLLGIEYADGMRASTLHDVRMMWPITEVSDQELVLSPCGGSADEQSADQKYWVSPLPPEGPMAFVLAWPAFGMPESQTVIDGAAIRIAAERSLSLWPQQPAGEVPAPPPLPRPSSGWFAEPPDMNRQ